MSKFSHAWHGNDIQSIASHTRQSIILTRFLFIKQLNLVEFILHGMK